MNRTITRPAIAAGALLALAAGAAASTTTTYGAPDFDRWNYPFNGTPGAQTDASLFSTGPFPAGQFDDRDATIVATFLTGADYAPGNGAGRYQINSARLTATTAPASDLAFEYDPTPDPPSFFGDPDPGRPIELFGTGFRGGFNALSWGETGPWGFGGPLDEDVRFAIPVDANGNDVSNNYRDGFAAAPFAVGQTGLAPGAFVPGNTTFTFDLDVANPGVQAFLQQGLNDGALSFTLSSLVITQQGGPTNFPILWMKENIEGGAPITLEIDAIVPAPGAGAALGLLALGALRRRR